MWISNASFHYSSAKYSSIMYHSSRWPPEYKYRPRQECALPATNNAPVRCTPQKERGIDQSNPLRCYKPDPHGGG